MGPVIGEPLPLVVGVALSPIPIVAAILMILSPGTGDAGSGFAAGWVAGILGVDVAIDYAVAADRLRPTLDRARTRWQDNSHAVLAIVLLVMGSVVLGTGIGGL
ncbi:hypothetical protein IU433_03860 [Nocardia puris]|uniref:Uncharacterized protein n=1 Tax=Nocardia puris TaxID=208602 RepID=A0A366DW80_9NOCA|nr:hypothetical protein [Nocardia puris]MBF6209911.1 hypothetical protein [Nocardia puris]MBF6366483.1 hypothetical protein [Nocardia puris]MBF6458178.1 hypothetical protein [Nocardia puris]RBO94350.1 hypothetical protein DFR74_102773 [Nocardia puris]